MSFPQNLRYLRRRANLTQGALGDQLGVDYATISNYESGKTQPRLELLTKLASLFHVSLEALRDADLTTVASRLAEPAVPAANKGQGRTPALSPGTQPAKHKMQVIIELDGTADGLERLFERLSAFNDTIAATD